MEKIIWTKKDTFESMRSKILKLKGKQVVNKKNEKAPLTIFDVGDVEKTQLESLGDGFIKFAEGDPKYRTSDSSYNFEGMDIKPMWGFYVEYGYENDKGQRVCMKYNFMIPRKKDYKTDLKECGYVLDSNHDFVFYEK